MAKKNKGFPNEMVVHRENDDDGNEWFVADPDTRSHADPDEEVDVAIYTLHRVGKVSTKIIVE